jgi:F-type H+-transporting ATPase subunit epsilon
MNIALMTPDKQLTIDEVEMVVATTPDGELGIMQGHLPLLTPVTVSMLKVQQARKRTQTFAVMGGLLYTDGATVTLLCQAADAAADIDAVRAEEARQRASARLQQANPQGVDIDRARLALARSMARIKAVSTFVNEKL